MGLVVALPHQEVEVCLDVLDHSFKERLVAFAGDRRTVERTALITKKGAILPDDLHLRGAVVVTSSHVLSNLCLPLLALGVGLEELLVPRCRVDCLQERCWRKANMISSLIRFAAVGKELLGVRNRCQAVLVRREKPSFHGCVQQVFDGVHNGRGVRHLRNAGQRASSALVAALQQIRQCSSHGVEVGIGRLSPLRGKLCDDWRCLSGFY
mmetsp:Transcript_79024/g.109754  ORF Transcript_79024/g.109754 Transcript_79024/m.109754 type:complete len:210 (-) Transcript_79024:20-649(-)